MRPQQTLMRECSCHWHLGLLTGPLDFDKFQSTAAVQVPALKPQLQTGLGRSQVTVLNRASCATLCNSCLSLCLKWRGILNCMLVCLVLPTMALISSTKALRKLIRIFSVGSPLCQPV